MIRGMLKRVFGSANDRILSRLKVNVDAINALETEYQGFSDRTLRAQTDKFRIRVNDGEPLDGILVEAFAIVREAAKRTLKQRHFVVQRL